MNPKIRFCLIIAYALAAPIALFYAYLFEHMREPSLPVIPLAAALLGLMSAGAAGFQVAELFADMEKDEAAKTVSRMQAEWFANYQIARAREESK